MQNVKVLRYSFTSIWITAVEFCGNWLYNRNYNNYINGASHVFTLDMMFFHIYMDRAWIEMLLSFCDFIRVQFRQILTLSNTRFPLLIPALKRMLIILQLLWAFVLFSWKKKSEKRCFKHSELELWSFSWSVFPHSCIFKKVRGNYIEVRDYLWIFSLRTEFRRRFLR